MKIKYNGKTWKFRLCDTKGITQEELQKMANANGYIQYEISRKWLFLVLVMVGE